jgi:hypothetical protein
MPHHDGTMGGEPWWHNGYNDATATTTTMAMATMTVTATVTKVSVALSLCRPAALGGVHRCRPSFFLFFQSIIGDARECSSLF